ncbi:DUF6082 family protein [Streptomyces sviceus]|uniref:DUF6082 family protein n=1 Tax=Streptomyces sviceus TaxID=285530 RepID=UPI00332FA30B
MLGRAVVVPVHVRLGGFALDVQNPQARRTGPARKRVGRIRAQRPRPALDRRRGDALLAEQLNRVAVEMHRANLIQLHHIFVGQLDRAIDDPSLAAVISSLEDLSEGKHRQLLFANREYGALLLGYRIGALDRSELLGSLRVLSKSRVFAEYWRLTAGARGSLAADSWEARVGRAVDVVMEEREDDLEEWWVMEKGQTET